MDDAFQRPLGVIHLKLFFNRKRLIHVANLGLLIRRVKHVLLGHPLLCVERTKLNRIRDNLSAEINRTAHNERSSPCTSSRNSNYCWIPAEAILLEASVAVPTTSGSSATEALTFAVCNSRHRTPVHASRRAPVEAAAPHRSAGAEIYVGSRR